jgi:hypothetical protein
VGEETNHKKQINYRIEVSQEKLNWPQGGRRAARSKALSKRLKQFLADT